MTASGAGLSFTLLVFHTSSGMSPFRPNHLLRFSRITSRALHVTKTQIVDERFIARPTHMASDMSKLVQQTEPEVIEPIIAQGQPNNGCTVGELQRRTVECVRGKCSRYTR